MNDEPSISSFTNATLDDQALHSIGRIIRACAEIEDLLTLFICVLAKTSVSKGIVMLGRSSYSAKLGIAEYLAKLNGVDAHTRYKTIFASSLTNGISCRNHVSHGVLMGLNTEGAYGFVTHDRLDPENGATVQKVHCYSSAYLKEVAAALERFIPAIEKDLELSSLRQTRYERSLEPHRKGQPQAKRGAEQKRPPRP